MSGANENAVAEVDLPTTGTASGNRPVVLSLAVRDQSSLHMSYMSFVEGGALFVPTTRHGSMGEDAFLVISLFSDPERYSLPGKIVWVTPAGSSGRQQGLGIKLGETDSCMQLRSKIEKLLGAAVSSKTATYTI